MELVHSAVCSLPLRPEATSLWLKKKRPLRELCFSQIDPTGNPVPIVRQGTLVYLTPTVIPYSVANAARLAATCLPEVMSGIEEELGALELRGVWDVHDCSIDHLCQIGALIASAQGMRSSEGGRQDTWEVNETELKLIRHVKVWRNEMLDPRIKWQIECRYLCFASLAND